MRASEHPEKCPICHRAYSFPLDNPPKMIENLEVIEPIARGFYSAVYNVRNVNIDRIFTVKVIPQDTYSKDKGYSKDFDDEIRRYNLAVDNKIAFPNLVHAGKCELTFGDVEIACYFMQMETVNGPTLRDFKKSDKLNSRSIAQITYDLLDFFRHTEVVQIHHNDLRDDNIKVEIRDGRFGEVDAIDRTVKAFVLDPGSLSNFDRSGGPYLRDITWIARHMSEMIAVYWPKARELDDPFELRTLTMLNNFVSLISGKEQARENDVEGYCIYIRNIVDSYDRTFDEPSVLITPGEYYNAQLMPSYYVPHLFCDPDLRFTNSLISPGNILLHGMRGCGKTILLKSLHFTARAQRQECEDKNEVVKRLREDSYVGLFASASALLTGPQNKQLYLHELLLAFSLDLVKSLRHCELNGFGKIDYRELNNLCEEIQRLVPWFETPPNVQDLKSVEMRIYKATLGAKTFKGEVDDLKVRETFEFISEVLTKSNDIWRNKHVLFLLDDLSRRYLNLEEVDLILDKLCIQSEKYSFKISTETPTLNLRTLGGEISWLDRDYKEVDLGREVMQVLKDSGNRFLEEVLRKRLLLTRDLKDFSPADLLGNQNLTDAAVSLLQQESAKRKSSYWGISVLGAVSTGDIGDSISLFYQMITKDRVSLIEGEGIEPRVQHDYIYQLSQRRLYALASRGSWLYNHALAFAQASKTEMVKSYRNMAVGKGGRIRQYSEVFLHIPPRAGKDLFNKINELVEGGVFVFAGGTPRTKKGLSSPLYFKLAYKKLYGVTTLSPISYGDRFELSGKAVEDWLENPTEDKLRKSVGKLDKGSSKEDDPAWYWIDEVKEGQRHPKLPSNKMKPGLQTQLGGSYKGKKISETPRDDTGIPLEVVSSPLGRLTPVDIKGKHIIGALGFEERSIGTWKNILKVKRPDKITMIEYKNPGLKDEILQFLGRNKVSVNTISYEDFINHDGPFMFRDDFVKEFLNTISTDDVVLDVTSMTKPLIYLLVSEVMKLRSKVGIIHTFAEKYLPTSNQIKETTSLLKQEQTAPEFFIQADNLVAGEKLGPQSRMTIKQHRNPGAGVFLVCFMSLKYKRAKRLLDELSPESIDIIFPLSSDGEKSPRSVFATRIAEALVGDKGEAWKIDSEDFGEAYRKLLELYSKKHLVSGMNFEIGLAGTKMHTVAAGMLGSIVNFSGVYYTPADFDPEKYTKGTGETKFTELKLVSARK
jgi:serine/threonine protein kinase